MNSKKHGDKNMSVDTSRMIDIAKLPLSKLEHIDETVALSNEAIKFLKSHKWCKKILQGMFDRGWGYILAVFYFAIEPAYENVPENIWVIVGDLPAAYIDVQDNPNGALAIEAYVMEMQKWVENVLQGKPVDELIPVNAPANEEYAKALQNRLRIIKEEILANCEAELRETLKGRTYKC